MAVVGVSPSQIVVQNVGERFSVNVTITNVTDLFGYELKIFYNSTQLDALYVSLPSDHFLRPFTIFGSFFIGKNTTGNVYNATHQFVWFLGMLTGLETARTGSGVLLTVHFNATATGGPYAVSIAYPGFSYPAKLSTPEASPIPCTSTSAQITVLPEFPTIIFMVALIAVTLAAAALGKTTRLRKLVTR